MPQGAHGSPLAAQPGAAPQSAVRLDAFADVVALAQARRDIQLKLALERDVRLVRFEEGRIEFELAPEGSPQTAANLTRRLTEWTGMRWMVSVVSGGGAPTMREARRRQGPQREGRCRRRPDGAACCSTPSRAPRSWRCAR